MKPHPWTRLARTATSLLAALVCFALMPGSAQTITGVVSGTVVDGSGLPVAGAVVTLLKCQPARFPRLAFTHVPARCAMRAGRWL